MKQRFFHGACLLLLLLVAAGCSMSQTPQVRLTALATQKDICRVAVLPFINETDRETAAVQAYRIFMAELVASGNYHVVPEGEIYFFRHRNRLRLGEPLDSTLFKELVQQIGVDTLLRGRVIALEERRSLSGNLPYCALQVDLVSAENGELLASSYHSRSGEEYQKLLHFGTIRTKSDLLAQVSREIIEVWKKKGLSHCSEE